MKTMELKQDKFAYLFRDLSTEMFGQKLNKNKLEAKTIAYTN